MAALKNVFNSLLNIQKGGLFHSRNKKLQPSRNVAFIELSNICNAKCIFCPYPQIAESDKKLQHMSESRFATSLTKAVELGYTRLAFTPTTGELFANKRWAEYIAAALRDEKIKSLYFYSNAILLTDENIRKILSLPNPQKIEKLYFSVGGLDAETYHKMFGVDKFKVVVRNINSLCEKLKNTASDLKVNCEFRLPKLDKATMRAANKLFNKAGYANFYPNIVRVFDPIGGLINEAVLEYLPEIADKTSPCYRLNDIRFDANGNIWMCGCVVSERPGESSLLIGSLEDTNDYIQQRKQAVFANWRTGELPSACKPCRVYKATKQA